MTKWRLLFPIAGITVVVLVAVLTWPGSTYRVYVEKRIEAAGDADKVRELVGSAAARAKRLAAIHRYLEFKIEPRTDGSSMPAQELGDQIKPGDLLSGEGGWTVDAGYIVFEGKIDFTGLFTQLQDFIADRVFGQRNHVIVVQGFKHDGGVSSERRRRLLAYVHPVDGSPVEFPDGGWGSYEELSNMVAWYLFKTFQGNPGACDRRLCVEDISKSLPSLRDTQRGFEILLRNEGHPECAGIELRREDCMIKAEKSFREALRKDPDNDHAHLGLGLIEMQRARDAAEAKFSAYTVGRHFMKSIGELHQARHANVYIEGLLDSKEWSELLTNSAGYRGLDLSPKFLGTAGKYREARRAMVECRYGDVVALIDGIEGEPEWMKGHLRLLRDMARLRLTEDRGGALRILGELEEHKRELPEEIWTHIFGIGSAQWAEDDSVLQKKAREALDRAVELARKPDSVLAAEANRARGLIMLGELDNARRQVNDVERTIGSIEDKKETLDLREIGLTLAMAYAGLGEFGPAAKWLARIIEMDDVYVETVRNSPYLKPFREQWTGYRDWRLRYMGGDDD